MAANIPFSTYENKDVAVQEQQILTNLTDGQETNNKALYHFEKPGSLDSRSTSSRSSSKLMARRWDSWLAVETRCRKEATLKAEAAAAAVLAKSMARAESSLIQVGMGRPAPEFFPWKSMMPGDLSQEARAISNSRASEGTTDKTPSINGTYAPYSMAAAFDYGETPGSSSLRRWIRDFTQMVHSPQYEDWSCCLTAGTTSAFEPIFRMLCERGDVLLTEAYTYTGASETARPLGLELLGIVMDDQGIVPSELDATLSAWDRQPQHRGDEEEGIHREGSRLERLARSRRKPFVLYTIPSGQNPSGATQSIQRRKEIYAVAEKHNLCIIEDDPYCFLRLGPSRSGNPQSDGSKYLNSLPPSYLSLDISGRVLHLESASKILAPGMRLGWLVGSSQLVTQFLQGAECTGASPPAGPSQLMLHHLFVESWGHAGLVRWLESLSSRYARRASIMLEACDRYLPKHLCSWTTPEAGMFIWIRVLKPHGLLSQTVEHEVFNRALEYGVQICKGSWFRINDEIDEVMVRITFVATSESELVPAVERLGRAIRAVLEDTK